MKAHTQKSYTFKSRPLSKVLSYIHKSTLKVSPQTTQDTSHSILMDTKLQLNFIVACILQTKVQEANNFTKKVGKALASKLAGVGISGGLLSLVPSLAIAGKGMAVSVVLGGLVMGVVLVTYKLFSSKGREYSDVSPYEREIIDKSILIIRLIDELDETLHFPDKQEMKGILKELIDPLNSLLIEHEKEIRKNLDTKNKLVFKVQALPNFAKLTTRYTSFTKN